MHKECQTKFKELEKEIFKLKEDNKLLAEHQKKIKYLIARVEGTKEQTSNVFIPNPNKQVYGKDSFISIGHKVAMDEQGEV
ncbi:MAG: hypothetical protein ACRCXT_23740 [Paraclostridium sp.]